MVLSIFIPFYGHFIPILGGLLDIAIPGEGGGVGEKLHHRIYFCCITSHRLLNSKPVKYGQERDSSNQLKSGTNGVKPNGKASYLTPQQVQLFGSAQHAMIRRTAETGKPS